MSVERRPGVGIVVPEGITPVDAILGVLRHVTSHLPTNRERIHHQIAIAREVIHFIERLLDGADMVADTCRLA